MHPRNRHTGRYDFKELTKIRPDLMRFVSLSPRGEQTIDFANPDAVKALNSALLKQFYDVSEWDIPPGYLCPPIPGRADYIHTIADLLGACNDGTVPTGKMIRVFDVGVGANCIYPIIGHGEYDWSFVGSEIDSVALDSAKNIVQKNLSLTGAIELRLQKTPTNTLKGVLLQDEIFDLLICNPPFHASLEEAQAGNRRKWNNLGKSPAGKKEAPNLNFGGQNSELWCPGGERAFVRRMIEESAEFAQKIFWFSSLISKEESLPALFGALEKCGVAESAIQEIVHGQKKSRVLVWTFLNPNQQAMWREKRWTQQ